MALKPNQALLLAIDSNVALDFADECDEVIDSLTTIRNRLRECTICAPPTVVLELGHAADLAKARKSGPPRGNSCNCIVLGSFGWFILFRRDKPRLFPLPTACAHKG